MKWQDAEPDLALNSLVDIFKVYGLINSLSFLQAQVDMLLVCHQSCWKNMIDHIKPHRVEMGGLILGSILLIIKGHNFS